MKLRLTISIFLLLIPVAIYSAGVPDTGQVLCFDANGTTLDPCPGPGEDFYGQDAQYNHLQQQPSYTKLDAYGQKLSDSVTVWSYVLDNITGLIWDTKKWSDNPLYSWTGSNFTWYDTDPENNDGYPGTPDGGNLTGKDTSWFLSQLNGASHFSNWRLPTPKELASIGLAVRIPTTLLPILSDSYIDGRYFPYPRSSNYWTQRSSKQSNLSAWRVSFLHAGLVTYGAKHTPITYARAVRGEKWPPENRFVDNGDGTVTDTATCLMWQQGTMDTNDDGIIDKEDMMDWKTALSTCEDLQLANHNDWRLPNSHELITLANHNRSLPAVDTTFFPDTVVLIPDGWGNGVYWTSTTWDNGRDYALAVWLGYYGDLNRMEKFRPWLVKAVRSLPCQSGQANFFWPLFLPAFMHHQE